MNIAIIGTEKLCEELIIVISQGNNTRIFEIDKIPSNESFDILIDLDFDKDTHKHWQYLNKVNASVFLLGATFIQLSSIHFDTKRNQVFGICALPTLLPRTTLEYSSAAGINLPENVVHSLNFKEALRVDDRVGMVTPRVVCMIINEAYYTVQEGTASRSDVDLGMKLGTAYPLGPFEWAKKIGEYNVYALLKAVYEDTMDERYKICNLLKTEALKVS
ncbi:MAG: 3-hydroxyacyl-CoA dehydrogenase family protein [Bacteroidia bacterium]|nr:3-hydroxyacyl-CoA dehydrogenase family protein [Bacteroidia bacterium]